MITRVSAVIRPEGLGDLSTFAVCGLEHVAADQWAALLARSAGLARRMVQMIADALPRPRRQRWPAMS